MIDPITHQPTFKLADFGIARQTPVPGQLATSVGTRWYMAPEVNVTSQYSQYNQQVDVYSLGRVMIYMNPQARPNSRWFNIVQQLTALNPSQRLFAYQVRDAAREANEQRWE